MISIDGPLVWRVREVGLSATGAPEAASSSFTLQRTGASIVRNELTSRRARLEAGEAYFMPPLISDQSAAMMFPPSSMDNR